MRFPEQLGKIAARQTDGRAECDGIDNLSAAPTFMMHAPSRVHELLGDAGDVRVGASLALSAAATQAPARQPFLLGPSQSQGLGFGALHAFEHGSPFGSDPLRAILTLNEAVRKDVQSGHARGQSPGALGPLRPLVARIATCG